jgi:hypothetical protein
VARLEEIVARFENHTGKGWRARAEECRAIAATFVNPETRAKMLLIAEDYERMAENAERREEELGGDEAGARGTSRSSTFRSSA